MKTFPAGFTAQKNTPAGAKPVWFLALPTAADGSGIVYISDRNVPVKNVSGVSVTTKAMVSSWGQIREGVTGQLGEYSVAEFRVHLLNDPTDPENIVHLIDNHDIETATTVLYCWFEGITDNAQTMFTGYVRDIVFDENDAGVELTLQDATLKSQRDVGIVATKALLGNSLDNNDVGKILPIVFGVASKVPTIRAIVPIRTTIMYGMETTETSIDVSDATGLVAGMYMSIDSERIYISAVSGQTLTVLRGANGTGAAAHDKGSTIIEYKITGFENFVFIAAGHALTNLAKVWSLINGQYVDISALCNRYNYNGWPGQTWATVKLPNTITIQQLTSLGLDDLSHAHTVEKHTMEQTAYNAPQGDYRTSGYWSGNWAGTLNFTAHGQSNVTSMIYEVTFIAYQATSIYIYANGYTFYNANISAHGTFTMSWEVTTGGAMTATGIAVQVTAAGTGSVTTPVGIWVTGAKRTVKYTKNADNSYSNTNLTGNQIAATLYENGIYCDMENYTFGSPKTVCDWLLTNYGPPGVTSVTADDNIHTAYINVNGCILEKKPLLYWLNRIAFEYRSRFKYSATGTAKLIYRPDTLTSAHTVTNAETRNFTRRRSDFDGIINKIDLRYKRDWSSNDAEPYTALTSVSDSTSQAKYGVKENAQAFQFDFLTDATLVGTIAAYYLAYCKVRHWIYEQEAFLDNMELEYADIITVGAVSGNPVGVITEASLSPGSDTEPDTIKLIVET